MRERGESLELRVRGREIYRYVLSTQFEGDCERVGGKGGEFCR